MKVLKKSIFRFYYIFPIALLMLAPAIGTLTLVTTDENSDYTFSELSSHSSASRYSQNHKQNIPPLDLNLGFEWATVLVLIIFIFLTNKYRVEKAKSTFHHIRAPPYQ